MNRTSSSGVRTAGTLAMLIAACALAAPAQPEVFRGEISDSQCATNVHSISRSHKEMLKTQNIGGTSADCARYCVKEMGGTYVLLIKNQVYHLDNQELAEKNAGQKVKVTGTLDSATQTIHVASILAVQ